MDIGVTPVNDPPKFDDPTSGNPNIDPVTGHYKATTEEDKPVSGKLDLRKGAIALAANGIPIEPRNFLKIWHG